MWWTSNSQEGTDWMPHYNMYWAKTAWICMACSQALAEYFALRKTQPFRQLQFVAKQLKNRSEFERLV